MSPRLVHVTTVPESLGFLRGQLRYMKSLGWDVHAISSPGPRLTDFGESEGIEIHSVEMPRRITPVHDLRSVAELTARLVRLGPTIVHAHTPKGGLLGMMSAVTARVPVRLYHMRGLPLATAQGARRRLLTATEMASCRMAHHVLCQSHSLRAQALELELCPPSKIEVIGAGSNGVDALGRFNPALQTGTRDQVRKELGWTDEHVVFGFVGRLVKDKGIGELATAWKQVSQQHPHARLLLVGPFEEGDPVPADTRAALECDPTVHLAGYSAQTTRWYAAMDVFVLPSYREGFPNAPLEAAAMALPVVATTVPGCTDAVADGVTGTLVPPANAHALAVAMLGYAGSREKRRSHGEVGRQRVLRDFQPASIWEGIAAVYERLSSQQVQPARSPGPVRS